VCKKFYAPAFVSMSSDRAWPIVASPSEPLGLSDSIFMAQEMPAPGLGKSWFPVVGISADRCGGGAVIGCTWSCWYIAEGFACPDAWYGQADQRLWMDKYVDACTVNAQNGQDLIGGGMYSSGYTHRI
jgi:hypothetical protein